MGQPGAKQGDQVVATDIHIVMIPTPGGPVPRPCRIPSWASSTARSARDVNFDGKPAATQGSTATNSPAHTPQGGPFQSPPKNRGEVMLGSTSVRINGKPAARNGDMALTCNDPADLPAGQVIAVGTVMIGG